MVKLDMQTQSQLIPSIPELKSYADKFSKEITAAAAGKPSSVSFLRHEIKPIVEAGKSAQIMVLGGTTFSTVLVSKKGADFEFTTTEQQPLPKFTDKEVFLDFVLKNLKPDIEFLALNFAYPLAPEERDGRLDCRLLRGSKEHEFNGLVGEFVGEQIEERAYKKLARTLKVTLANDTVCLVLAGLSVVGEDKPLAAGISGTGANFGILQPSKLVINLESGNFSGLEQSTAGRAIDRDSAQPGKQLFEKEVTGGYLYKHYNYYLKELNLAGTEVGSTYELNKLAADGNEFARLLFQRSAALFSSQVAGVFNYLGGTHLNLVLDGSIFWSGYGYQFNVRNYLEQMGIPSADIQFLQVPNRSVLGAAQLLY